MDLVVDDLVRSVRSMRHGFGETRDPAPTTMEESSAAWWRDFPGWTCSLDGPSVARSGERPAERGGLEFAEHRDYEPVTTFGLWTGMCLPVWIGW